MIDTKKTFPGLGIRSTKRPLGRILVDGEFVSPHDLEVATERQKRTNGQLVEILVGMGVLNPRDLKAVLSVQRDLASLDDAVKAAAGVRMLLGELLIKAKRITPAQLDLALEEQKRTGIKLGEILMSRGLLTENELEAVLAFQKRQSGGSAVSERFRLGEILVATEQITRKQLEDVLKHQKLSRKKIGELLIEAGYVKPHQIDYGLRLQQKLLTAALVAVLSMSNLLWAQEAYSGGSAVTSASSKVTVTATVLAHTSLKTIRQVQELIVTNADISRGYVDIPAASRIVVNNNNPAGYLLVFEGIDGPFRLINNMYVKVGGREIQLSPGGGWVHQPYARGAVTVELSYRFTLSEHAEPGTYAWPLAISVLPI